MILTNLADGAEGRERVPVAGAENSWDQVRRFGLVW
jgi:hypothetical protein